MVLHRTVNPASFDMRGSIPWSPTNIPCGYGRMAQAAAFQADHASLILAARSTFIGNVFHVSVAQLAAQRLPNPKAAGSSPAWDAILHWLCQCRSACRINFYRKDARAVKGRCFESRWIDKVTGVRIPVLPPCFGDCSLAVLAPDWKSGGWFAPAGVQLLQSPPVLFSP